MAHSTPSPPPRHTASSTIYSSTESERRSCYVYSKHWPNSLRQSQRRIRLVNRKPIFDFPNRRQDSLSERPPEHSFEIEIQFVRKLNLDFERMLRWSFAQ